RRLELQHTWRIVEVAVEDRQLHGVVHRHCRARRERVAHRPEQRPVERGLAQAAANPEERDHPGEPSTAPPRRGRRDERYFCRLQRMVRMGMFFSSRKLRMPQPDEALPGRQVAMRVDGTHFVNGHRFVPPFPDGMQRAVFGMGCFWGAERKFWEAPGVYTTAVGYAGGITPNPTYEEVCSGRTGHTEVVLVVFDPALTLYEAILRVFWENHDPTQGMRQGNDVGTQYRSAIYTFGDAQARAVDASRQMFG